MMLSVLPGTRFKNNEYVQRVLGTLAQHGLHREVENPKLHNTQVHLHRAEKHVGHGLDDYHLAVVLTDDIGCVMEVGSDPNDDRLKQLIDKYQQSVAHHGE